MLPLFNALFLETNPIPVKKGLEMMGLIGPEIRLPLLPMTPAGTEKLKAVMQQVGII
ncbi:MAG: dihydrodipicolinate synthase family protein [Deferribacterales bacterium]